MKWSKAVDGHDLSWSDCLTLVQYYDNTYRSLIFVTSLSVALLAYAKAYQRYAILMLCALLILMTMCFSIYTMIQLTAVLRRTKHYTRVNTIYYFAATMILFFIGLFIFLGIDWEKLIQERKLHFQFEFTKDDKK